MIEEPGSPVPGPTGWAAIREDFPGNEEVGDAAEEARWREHKAILRRAAEELAQRRAKAKAAALVGTDDSFQRLAYSLEYASPKACNLAVRTLYSLDPDRAASFFNLALRESSLERRKKIGAALAGSGLVSVAIENLASGGQQKSYSAFSLLFLVAKAGEVQPLIQLIERHPNMELRLAVVRLLGSSGERDILPALEQLLTGDLPPHLQSAIIEAINQISQTSTPPSAS
jgi:hypothetical protein